MDNTFKQILDKFSTTIDKELLAIELLVALKIEKHQINVALIEPLIGRQMTDAEKFKLDILYRAIMFNPEIYLCGEGGEDEDDGDCEGGGDEEE